VLGRDADELARELADGRAQLLAERERRVHPALDDKVLVAWNGLMIDALAQAAGVLDEPRYLAAAARAAEFILGQMRQSDGRLLHSWRQGKAKLAAYLDDYSFLVNALVSLYEADFDERWIDAAIDLTGRMLGLFHDPAQGGFFFTASDHETLITRPKDLYDNAVPSGNSMAAMVLLRLGKLTGRDDYLSAAESTLRAAVALMQQAPRGTGQMLLALDFFLGPTPEIVVVGDARQAETAAALADLRHRFVPNKLLACRRADPIAEGSTALALLFAGKDAREPEPTVFVCENFACQEPVFGKGAAVAQWRALARSASEPNR
jgi:uncharacterized protein YyaL (SSP411 family)